MIDRNWKSLEGSRPYIRGSGCQAASHLHTSHPAGVDRAAGGRFDEFPDVGTAKRWYESPAYQKARQLVRNGVADIELFIIDGGYIPPAERLPHIK